MSKSPLTRLALALALPAMGVAALSVPALANVRSATTGASCQFQFDEIRGGVPLEPSRPRLFSAYTPEHGIWWDSLDALDSRIPILCPLVRNLPLSTDGLSDLEVRFRSAKSTVSREVSCMAISFRPDGTIIDSLEKHVTVAPSQSVPGTTPGTPGSVKDSFATMDFANAIGVSANKGHYALECWMPTGVGLMSIYSSEVDGVNGN